MAPTNKHIEQGRARIIALYKKAEDKMLDINKQHLDEIAKLIAANGYQWDAKLARKIRKELKDMGAATEEVIAGIETTMLATTQTALSLTATAEKAVISTRELTHLISSLRRPKLSDLLHDKNLAVRAEVFAQIKKSVVKGEDAGRLVKALLKVEGMKAPFPKYLKELEAATRAMLKDPAQYKAFRAALKKHSKYLGQLKPIQLNELRSLGLQADGRKLIKELNQLGKEFAGDYSKATEVELTRIVSEFMAQKARYMQTQVARTEINNAYHDYTRAYINSEKTLAAGAIPHLSAQHPTDRADNSCEDKAEKYYPAPVKEEDLPSYHTNCMCSVELIYPGDPRIVEEAA